MRERVKVAPAPVIMKYVFAPKLASDSKDSFAALMALNQAHVVMLAAQGIVPRQKAAQLMRVLEEVLQAGPDAVEWDPALEEVYYNLEAHIIKKAGPAIGGQLHTGRSRNDLSAAVTRIYARDQLLKLAAFLHDLRTVLLNLAEEHVRTVVTGYTHMQPAQPTTLGHYFHALAQALARDDERLQHAYLVTNLSPLGACAFNATGFPIDRHMLADLIGFAGLVENSIDAVATRDYVTEILGALAIMGTNLSRLAQDLYIWCTDEFGWVEVADDLAATSSIMPQKKNPITLEHIRGRSAHLIAAMVSSLAAQKGVPYGHLRDISYESTHALDEGFREAEAMINLMAATLRSLRVDAEAAKKRTYLNFSTVTELADVLVREKGLSFREAHGLIGAVVREVLDNGGTTLDITPAQLDRIAVEQLGRPIELAESSLKRALNPEENVAVRSVTGGPAPEEELRSLAASRERLHAHQLWWQEQSNRLEQARQRLDAAVAQFTHE